MKSKYEKKEIENLHFGDIVKYEKHLWKFVGITEDYEYVLARDSDIIGQIDIVYVYAEDWDNVLL